MMTKPIARRVRIFPCQSPRIWGLLEWDELTYVSQELRSLERGEEGLLALIETFQHIFFLVLSLFPGNFPLLWLLLVTPFAFHSVSVLTSNVCYEIVLIFSFYCRLSRVGGPD